MAHYQEPGVHRVERIVARAGHATSNEGKPVEWLNLIFSGQGDECRLTVFMPYQSAARIARAINDAQPIEATA